MRHFHLRALINAQGTQALAFFRGELGPVHRHDFCGVARGEQVESHRFGHKPPVPETPLNCN
ncbi:hypothetical protein AEB_P1132 [Altererythrobacter sp. B11]|nr:hypothetical protein AEB_P1132 [Altererythrobacter sp. B11]